MKGIIENNQNFYWRNQEENKIKRLGTEMKHATTKRTDMYFATAWEWRRGKEENLTTGAPTLSVQWHNPHDEKEYMAAHP